MPAWFRRIPSWHGERERVHGGGGGGILIENHRRGNSFVDGVDAGGGGSGCGSGYVRRTAGPSQRSPRRGFLTGNPTASHDRTLSASAITCYLLL
ncbi:hypothetical protein RUM44_013955 [Polyplax serrata]|uniref:Uncharacterized protein n=1 Tax=Polyplax serrata TaxID=468196 RepID=A0ABR1BFW9_POLSC